MYKVKLSSTYSSVEFSFTDWSDATNFAGMAIEHGRDGNEPLQAAISKYERGLENEDL